MVAREQYFADRRLQAHYVQQTRRALKAYLERLERLENFHPCPPFEGATVAELREIDEADNVRLNAEWKLLRDLQLEAGAR